MFKFIRRFWNGGSSENLSDRTRYRRKLRIDIWFSTKPAGKDEIDLQWAPTEALVQELLSRHDLGVILLERSKISDEDPASMMWKTGDLRSCLAMAEDAAELFTSRLFDEDGYDEPYFGDDEDDDEPFGDAAYAD